MERKLNSQLKEFIGEEVIIRGWMNSLRVLGKISFLIMRDRSGFVQVVVEDLEELEKVKSLQPGSVLTIKAKVVEAEKTEYGYELIEPEIQVESGVTEPLPVEYNKSEIRADIDTIIDYRPLTLRNRKLAAVFRVQAGIVRAYREYLTERGFVEFFGPNIISASSEGGSELFTVNYFDHEVKLSQSAQLYKQIMVGVYERVFALMKCFRAEKSNTRRHLTEATQFEFEMGFIESYEEVMDMLEGVIKHIVKTLEIDYAKELEILEVEMVKAPKEVSFPRVTFKEALEIYFERTGIDERDEIDLSPAAEKELCKYAREEFGTDFIFVKEFLRKKAAFYAHPNQDNPEVVNYFDLLGREAEIVSGGQRIHDHDMLVESLEIKGLDPADFGDYLSIFKYGMPKHGGFGMGMERLTMMLLGLDNIREAVLFPSDTKRVAGVKLPKVVFKGAELTEKILKLLDDEGIEYELLEHKAVETSQESAQVRGTKLEEGVKSLMLIGKKSKKIYQFNLPADQQMDFKQAKKLVGEELTFADPEQVSKEFDLEKGAVPPFGNLMGVETYYSKQIFENEQVAFNVGSKEKSLVLSGESFLSTIIEGGKLF